MCPMPLRWLQILYWTIQNVLTLRYAPIIAQLKILIYPTHFDNYGLAIKFITLSRSKFYLFSFGFVIRSKGHSQMTDSD